MALKARTISSNETLLVGDTYKSRGTLEVWANIEPHWVGSTPDKIDPNDKLMFRRIVSDERSTQDVNAIQHGGTHYKTVPIQPWDYIAANNIGFFEGSAIKYLTRWKDKGGITDLKKAIHFIEKLVAVEEARIADKPPLIEPALF